MPDATPVLTHDPFVRASDELFGAGDRTRQLDELRHLSRWSRRLLVVTGDHGVGKSTLFRALSKRLESGVKAARINANLINDELEVLTAIVQGFGLAAPTRTNVNLLTELIVDHVREQAEANRYCVVLVDDAHVLELRAVARILRLVSLGEDKGMRVVFFAEAHFVPILDKAAHRLPKPLQWHEIRLSPFSFAEVKSYLGWRLGHAGWEGRLPFAEPQLKVLYQNSRGLPGRVNEMASAILAGSFKVAGDSRFLPPLHRAVVLLITVLIGTVWLVWDRLRGDDDVQVEALLAAQSERVVAPSDPGGIEPGAGSDPGVEIEPVEVTAARVPVVVLDDSDEPTAEAPAAPEEPELVPAPTTGPGVHDADWILAQPQDHYTLQLFGTSNRNRLDEFLERQQQPARFAVFSRRREGESWYVVLYGNYPDRAGADAASRQLPASVGKVDPWIRTFGSVQTNVRGR